MRILANSSSVNWTVLSSWSVGASEIREEASGVRGEGKGGGGIRVVSEGGDLLEGGIG